MEIHSAIVFQRKLSKDDRFSTSILVVALSFKQQLPDILTGSLFFCTLSLSWFVPGNCCRVYPMVSTYLKATLRNSSCSSCEFRGFCQPLHLRHIPLRGDWCFLAGFVTTWTLEPPRATKKKRGNWMVTGWYSAERSYGKSPFQTR